MPQQLPPPPPPTEPTPTETQPVSPPVPPSSRSSILQYQPLQRYSNVDTNSHKNTTTNTTTNTSNDTTNSQKQYRIAAPKRNTISYQQSCILQPIPSSILFGALYTTYDTLRKQMSPSRNQPQQQRHRNPTATTTSNASSSFLRTLGSSVGIIYVYYVIQCPMEGVQNKESYIHNGIAAFTLSYIGLAQQRIGVPFISPYSIYQFPLLARNLLGASIYSCMAMTFAAVYGRKPY